MIEVGVRHHIDTESPVTPVLYRITDSTERFGLRHHDCDLRCEPVYVKEAGDGN